MTDSIPRYLRVATPIWWISHVIDDDVIDIHVEYSATLKNGDPVTFRELLVNENIIKEICQKIPLFHVNTNERIEW